MLQDISEVCYAWLFDPRLKRPRRHKLVWGLFYLTQFCLALDFLAHNSRRSARYRVIMRAILPDMQKTLLTKDFSSEIWQQFLVAVFNGINAPHLVRPKWKDLACVYSVFSS
jgi:hypothetical protein